MVDITKPIYGDIWASAGEKLSPQPDKIATGWVQEMMPYQYENFLQNRTDVALSYLLQKGIPEWSAEQEYTANKSVVTYSSQLYLAIATTTGVVPTTVASWRRLTMTFAANGAVPVAFGGTGATNASDARANLGVGTAGAVDLPVANGVVIKNSSGSLIARNIAGTAGYITVSNADGQSGNPTINVGVNIAKTDADAAWTTTSSIKLPSGSTAERGIGVSGRIRFNSELGRFEGHNGTDWNSLGDSSGTIPVQTFPTNGVQATFTLPFIPASKNNILVYNNGIYQDASAFSLSGAVISFSESPESGTLTVVPMSAAPTAPTNGWTPQAPISDAVSGTEISTINAILVVMRTAGLILP